jgi:hypothetical protein
MGRTMYHNITKELINEYEMIDFVENYDEGDIIYKSEDGNACIEKISSDEMNKYIKGVEEWYNENHAHEY